MIFSSGTPNLATIAEQSANTSRWSAAQGAVHAKSYRSSNKDGRALQSVQPGILYNMMRL
jgi:hypothetical protein